MADETDFPPPPTGAIDFSAASTLARLKAEQARRRYKIGQDPSDAAEEEVAPEFQVHKPYAPPAAPAPEGGGFLDSLEKVVHYPAEVLAGGMQVGGQLLRPILPEAYAAARRERFGPTGEAPNAFEAAFGNPGAGDVLAQTVPEGVRDSLIGRALGPLGRLAGNIVGDPLTWASAGATAFTEVGQATKAVDAIGTALRTAALAGDMEKASELAVALQGAQETLKTAQAAAPIAASVVQGGAFGPLGKFGHVLPAAVYGPAVVRGAVQQGEEVQRQAQAGEYAKAAASGVDTLLQSGLAALMAHGALSQSDAYNVLINKARRSNPMGRVTPQDQAVAASTTPEQAPPEPAAQPPAPAEPVAPQEATPPPVQAMTLAPTVQPSQVPPAALEALSTQALSKSQERVRGRADVPLSPAGEAQADSLAPQLNVRPQDVVFASDLQRSQETARRATGKEPIVDPRLGPHINGLEGQLVKDVEPTIKAAPQNPDTALVPGSEPFRTFDERYTSFVNDIREEAANNPDKNYYAFTHYRNARLREARDTTGNWTEPFSPAEASEMAKPDGSPPGSVEQDAAQPNVYWVRHGATAWNPLETKSPEGAAPEGAKLPAHPALHDRVVEAVKAHQAAGNDTLSLPQLGKILEDVGGPKGNKGRERWMKQLTEFGVVGPAQEGKTQKGRAILLPAATREAEAQVPQPSAPTEPAPEAPAPPPGSQPGPGERPFHPMDEELAKPEVRAAVLDNLKTIARDAKKTVDALTQDDIRKAVPGQDAAAKAQRAVLHRLLKGIHASIARGEDVPELRGEEAAPPTPKTQGPYKVGDLLPSGKYVHEVDEAGKVAVVGKKPPTEEPAPTPLAPKEEAAPPAPGEKPRTVTERLRQFQKELPRGEEYAAQLREEASRLTPEQLAKQREAARVPGPKAEEKPGAGPKGRWQQARNLQDMEDRLQSMKEEAQKIRDQEGGTLSQTLAGMPGFEELDNEISRLYEEGHKPTTLSFEDWTKENVKPIKADLSGPGRVQTMAVPEESLRGVTTSKRVHPGGPTEAPEPLRYSPKESKQISEMVKALTGLDVSPESELDLKAVYGEGQKGEAAKTIYASQSPAGRVAKKFKILGEDAAEHLQDQLAKIFTGAKRGSDAAFKTVAKIVEENKGDPKALQANLENYLFSTARNAMRDALEKKHNTRLFNELANEGTINGEEAPPELVDVARSLRDKQQAEVEGIPGTGQTPFLAGKGKTVERLSDAPTTHKVVMAGTRLEAGKEPGKIAAKAEAALKLPGASTEDKLNAVAKLANLATTFKEAENKEPWLRPLRAVYKEVTGKDADPKQNAGRLAQSIATQLGESAQDFVKRQVEVTPGAKGALKGLREKGVTFEKEAEPEELAATTQKVGTPSTRRSFDAALKEAVPVGDTGAKVVALTPVDPKVNTDMAKAAEPLVSAFEKAHATISRILGRDVPFTGFTTSERVFGVTSSDAKNVAYNPVASVAAVERSMAGQPLTARILEAARRLANTVIHEGLGHVALLSNDNPLVRKLHLEEPAGGHGTLFDQSYYAALKELAESGDYDKLVNNFKEALGDGTYESLQDLVPEYQKRWEDAKRSEGAVGVGADQGRVAAAGRAGERGAEGAPGGAEPGVRPGGAVPGGGEGQAGRVGGGPADRRGAAEGGPARDGRTLSQQDLESSALSRDGVAKEVGVIPPKANEDEKAASQRINKIMDGPKLTFAKAKELSDKIVEELYTPSTPAEDAAVAASKPKGDRNKVPGSLDIKENLERMSENADEKTLASFARARAEIDKDNRPITHAWINEDAARLLDAMSPEELITKLRKSGVKTVGEMRALLQVGADTFRDLQGAYDNLKGAIASGDMDAIGKAHEQVRQASFMRAASSLALTDPLSLSGRNLNIARQTIRAADPRLGFDAKLRAALRSHLPAEQVEPVFSAFKTASESGDWASFNKLLNTAFNPTLADKTLEFVKAGMLSYPSMVAKAGGDLVMGGLRTAESAVATLLDMARSKLTGAERSRYIGEGAVGVRALRRAMAEGMPELTRAMIDAASLKTPNMGEQLMKRSAMDPLELRSASGAIGGKLGEWTRIPFKVFGAITNLAQHTARLNELYRRAYRMAVKEGLKGDDLHVRTDAIADTMINAAREFMLGNETKEYRLYKDHINAAEEVAKRQTFSEALGQQDLLSYVGQEVQKMTRRYKSLQAVLPFVHIPTNIAREALIRTPWGFVQATKKMMSGKLDAAQVAEEYAKPLLGSTIAGVATLMAIEGTLTGQGPDDPAQQETLKESGWQPYSFKLGNTYIPFHRLEPIASVLGLAADMGEAIRRKDTDSVAKFSKRLVASVTENFTNKTFLQGLEGLFQAWTNPVEYAGQFIKQTESMAVPNIWGLIPIGTAAKAIDPTFRKTSIGLTPLIAKIPGLSQTLPPQYGTTGEPRERPGSVLSRLLSPIQISELKTTPAAKVAQEMDRINWSPQRPRDYLYVGGRKVYYTKEETAALAKAQAAAVQDMYRTIGSESYKKMPDTDLDIPPGSKVPTKESILKRLLERRRDQVLQQINFHAKQRAAKGILEP